jgi:DNA-binding transcriptional regulator YiaG
MCTEASVRKAGKLCQSVRGVSIDAAISELLQDVLSPAAIEVALAVQEEIAERIQHTEALRQQQLERARYEAELARRRYLKVDPDNRLVADTLEAEWNDKLRLLNQLQQEHDQQRKADQSLTPQNKAERLLTIEKDFARVWKDPSIPALERKRIIAYLIEDVTLIKAEQVMLHIRFKGGKTHSLLIPRPIPIARIRKTRSEVIEALDQLLDTCTDKEAAAELNKMGYKNWKGDTLTFKKVTGIRQTYGLKSRFQRLREQGLLTGHEMARTLGVCTTTVHNWGREGFLRRQLYGNDKRCLYEPLPADHVFVKGQGGRYFSRPKSFITVQSPE